MEQKQGGTSLTSQLIAIGELDYSERNPIKPGKYSAKRIFSGERAQITEIAFDAGVLLADHMARSPIIVQVVSGEVEFKVDGQTHLMTIGGSIFVEANVMHAVYAAKPARITVTFLSA